MKSRLGPPEMLHGATRLIRSAADTTETKEKAELDTESDSDLIGQVIECFVCSWVGSAGFARAALFEDVSANLTGAAKFADFGTSKYF
jgi:hypothetical protein